MHPDLLPMNAAALMDRVFDLYKATFKTQIAFSLIIGTISILFMIILGIIMAVAIQGALGVTGAGSIDDRVILISVIAILIGVLPLYIGWLYLSASGHILISKQAFYGEPIELPFIETLRAFLRIMSAAIAQALLSAPWLIPLGLLIYFADAQDGFYYVILAGLHPALIVLFLLLYVILYFIYSNTFALSIPVAIFEKRLFISTILRSFVLLKGDFWRILGLRLLWAFLISLFSFSLQGMILMIVAVLAAFSGNVLDFEATWYATMTIRFYAPLFAGVLVGPMEGIMTALIYFNQKIKKDGLDIEIGLSRLTRGMS